MPPASLPIPPELYSLTSNFESELPSAGSNKHLASAALPKPCCQLSENEHTSINVDLDHWGEELLSCSSYIQPGASSMEHATAGSYVRKAPITCTILQEPHSLPSPLWSHCPANQRLHLWHLLAPCDKHTTQLSDDALK